MTEEKKSKSDSRIVIIAAIAVIAAIIIGVLVYNQNKNEKTITLSIGDKSFKATIQE